MLTHPNSICPVCNRINRQRAATSLIGHREQRDIFFLNLMAKSRAGQVIDQR